MLAPPRRGVQVGAVSPQSSGCPSGGPGASSFMADPISVKFTTKSSPPVPSCKDLVRKAVCFQHLIRYTLMILLITCVIRVDDDPGRGMSPETRAFSMAIHDFCRPCRPVAIERVAGRDDIASGCGRFWLGSSIVCSWHPPETSIPTSAISVWFRLISRPPTDRLAFRNKPRTVAIDPAGNIVIAGSDSTDPDGKESNSDGEIGAVARLEANGNLDNSFNGPERSSSMTRAPTPRVITMLSTV